MPLINILKSLLPLTNLTNSSSLQNGKTALEILTPSSSRIHRLHTCHIGEIVSGLKTSHSVTVLNITCVFVKLHSFDDNNSPSLGLVHPVRNPGSATDYLCRC